MPGPYPCHSFEVRDVVVKADELMHHGLVRPLHQEWGHRVLLAVQQEHEGRCLSHTPAPKVKELPLIHGGQMMEGLGQLLAHL